MKPMERREWDAIVVGLGGLGSAAAYWLSRRPGLRVLGLERYDMDHDNGASRDHSRIIRLSHGDRGYLRLARRALATWADVEAEAGPGIVTMTGGLDLAPRAGAHLEGHAAALAAEGVPFERLSGDDVVRWWPQWRLDDRHEAIHSADSGFVDPNRANAAHRRIARERGAVLVDRTPVTALRTVEGGVEVEAGGVRHAAPRAILAAAAWTNRLLGPLGAALPLRVTQEQVTYFACPQPADFAPDRFPIWIWHGPRSFYGFPVHGEAGPKAAEHLGGPEVTPETRTFVPDPAASARLRAFLGEHLPGALGPDIRTKTCLYTLTPDEDFVLGPVPGHPAILVAVGCGHGFKFASVIGRILAELAIEGSTPSAAEIAAFSADRPALRTAGTGPA
jgi:sarcosine oxidase